MTLDNSNDLMISNSITLYLEEIQKYPLLTEDQERELFQRMSEGDFEAKEILIQSNLRLVVYVANQYINRGMEYLDLIQEGNIALIKAVEKFDYNKGYKFSTYAVTVLQNLINRGIRNKSRNIRIPVWLYDELVEYRRIYEDLKSKLYREPTLKEIAEMMGEQVEKVKIYQNVEQDTISLNTIVNNSKIDYETYKLEDIIKYDGEIGVEDLVIKGNLKDELNKLIQEAALNERELDFLNRRYGLDGQNPLSLTEIAVQENSHRQNMYNKEQRILKKLRKNGNFKLL